jgi:hypothetical protein
MLEVLAGTANSMMIEGIGEAGGGIEFSVIRPSGLVEAHQVKRQSGNANSWSIVRLVSLGVIRAAAAQIAMGREFHFVSMVPARKLQELAERSRSADSLEVFRTILTGDTNPDFEILAKTLGSQSRAFEVLRSLRVRVIDELDLSNTNTMLARLIPIGGAPAPAATAVLAEIALDNLGRTLDGAGLRADLENYGLRLTDIAPIHSLGAVLREVESVRSSRIGAIGDQLLKVRQLAPPDGLVGRELETAQLAQFCRGAESYLWLAGVPWAGKTALLAAFVLNPPDGIDVLSFFVTSGTSRDADGDAFIDAIMNQLADLLGESNALPSEPRERETTRRQLLSLAADRAERQGRRLLLVVDGLDEDRADGGARGAPSVASLLPADSRPGLQVIVAARTGYQIPPDVRGNHPLRNCRRIEIATSPSAKLQQAAAEQEFSSLLADDNRRELLAFLAAARGGLSKQDLAALTGMAPFAISEAFRGVASRTVVVDSSFDYDPGGYVFAHEQLLEAAEAAFGSAQMEERRSLLENWADKYKEAGWPSETPHYLLANYGLLLADPKRAPAMVLLATDSLRHERMLDMINGHASALREIDAASQLLLGDRPEDLRSALRVAMERHEVAVGHMVSFSISKTWAAVGHAGRAEALARSAGNPRDVMRALVALAVALTRYGNYQLAEKILGTTGHAEWADAAVARMARESARLGDVAATARLAGRVVRAPFADRAFAALIGVAADKGAFDWAERLLHNEVTDPRIRAQAVAAIVAAHARSGDTEIALDRAKSETERAVRVAALEALARVTESRRDLAMFEVAVGEIDVPAIVDSCRAESVAVIYASDGLEAAEALIATLRNRRAKDRGWVQLALGLARDRRLTEAREAVANVVLAPTEAAITLAKAIAESRDFENAERMAKDIHKPEGRAHGLGAIAQIAATLGEFDRAEYLARQIAKPEGTAVSLAAIARVSYRSGSPDRAYELAAAAEKLYRDRGKVLRVSRALQAIATALAAIGDVSRSVKLFDLITEQGDRDIVAEYLAPELIRAGLHDNAESLVATIGSNRRKRSAIGASAIAYAQVGKRSHCDGLIKRLAGTPQGVVTMSRVAEWLAATGDLSAARDLSRLAAENLDDLAMGRADNVVVSVARALASCANVENALTLARGAEDSHVRQAAVGEVAAVLADASYIQEAKMLVPELSEIELRNGVLIRLIKATIAVGQLSAAYSLLEDIRGDWSKAVARATMASSLISISPDLCDGLIREAAELGRRSPSPARTLGDSAVACARASLKSARALLAEAFTFGSWILLLPALSQVDPDLLMELADSYIR